MKVTNEQLELTKIMWEQARERAALTTAAAGRLQESRRALIDSLQALGVSQLDATKEFQKYLDAHWEEFGKATEEMNRTSELYGELYKKYKAQQDKP
jgi:DNA anti-recombination protein RmuC